GLAVLAGSGPPPAAARSATQSLAKPCSASFVTLVGRQICAYVLGNLQRLPLMPDHAVSSMPLRVRPAVWAGAGIAGALAAASILLWAHYGSAVFFETVMAGLAFCF